ncbi:MAG: hypothetical protein ACI8Z1_000850, partial [Candidatus Azotimanducaceae bacterium]
PSTLNTETKPGSASRARVRSIPPGSTNPAHVPPKAEHGDPFISRLRGRTFPKEPFESSNSEITTSPTATAPFNTKHRDKTRVGVSCASPIDPAWLHQSSPCSAQGGTWGPFISRLRGRTFPKEPVESSTRSTAARPEPQPNSIHKSTNQYPLILNRPINNILQLTPKVKAP